jgi:hypothetical protein
MALAAVADADAGGASVCAGQRLSGRLDDADAAIVGRVVDVVEGDRSRFLTVEVDPRVKGEVERTIYVRLSIYTAVEVPPDEPIGLLLARAPDGGWLCSLVPPGPLVVEGGEPRGGVIKVGIGIVILGLVLLWALRRLKRGARPDLPGAPRP